MLKEIFWRKRIEITGDWKRLHNEELYGLYSGDETTKNETEGACSTYEGERRIDGLLGKP